MFYMLHIIKHQMHYNIFEKQELFVAGLFVVVLHSD